MILDMTYLDVKPAFVVCTEIAGAAYFHVY